MSKGWARAKSLTRTPVVSENEAYRKSRANAAERKELLQAIEPAETESRRFDKAQVVPSHLLAWRKQAHGHVTATVPDEEEKSEVTKVLDARVAGRVVAWGKRAQAEKRSLPTSDVQAEREDVTPMSKGYQALLKALSKNRFFAEREDDLISTADTAAVELAMMISELAELNGLKQRAARLELENTKLKSCHARDAKDWDKMIRLVENQMKRGKSSAADANTLKELLGSRHKRDAFLAAENGDQSSSTLKHPEAGDGASAAENRADALNKELTALKSQRQLDASDQDQLIRQVNTLKGQISADAAVKASLSLRNALEKSTDALEKEVTALKFHVDTERKRAQTMSVELDTLKGQISADAAVKASLIEENAHFMSDWQLLAQADVRQGDYVEALNKEIGELKTERRLAEEAVKMAAESDARCRYLAACLAVTRAELQDAKDEVGWLMDHLPDLEKRAREQALLIEEQAQLIDSLTRTVAALRCVK